MGINRGQLSEQPSTPAHVLCHCHCHLPLAAPLRQLSCALPAPVFTIFRFCADFSRKINNLLPLHPDAVSYLRLPPATVLSTAPSLCHTNLTSSWHFRNKIVIKHIGHVISFVCGILLPFFRAILNCYKCDGLRPGPVCLLSQPSTVLCVLIYL